MCKRIFCKFIFQKSSTLQVTLLILISQCLTVQSQISSIAPEFTTLHNGTHNETGNPHDNQSSNIHEEEGGHGHKGIILIPVHFSHVEYPLIFSLVVIFAGLSKLGFHYSHFLSSKVPESW
jgi:hypothetical protein